MIATRWKGTKGNILLEENNILPIYAWWYILMIYPVDEPRWLRRKWKLVGWRKGEIIKQIVIFICRNSFLREITFHLNCSLLTGDSRKLFIEIFSKNWIAVLRSVQPESITRQSSLWSGRLVTESSLTIFRLPVVTWWHACYSFGRMIF